MKQSTAVTLTQSSLLQSLSAIADAKSEDQCASALVAAATLIQGAIQADQPVDSFNEALGACPDNLRPQLAATMDRAVSFHLQEDGGTLGLWLVPVVLQADDILPPVLPLETASMHAMRLNAALLNQFKLTREHLAASSPLGWTFLLPELYAYEQLSAADIGELIRLPQQARAKVQGGRRDIRFWTCDEQPREDARTQLYFLPVVAYHPAHVGVPAASEVVVQRLTTWIRKSLPNFNEETLAVRVGSQPQPFAVGLTAGTRLRSDVRFRDIMSEVVQRSGVEPNGMAALVAPYSTQNRDGEIMLGVSLVSRLTGSRVATVALPVESNTGSEEVALATSLLKEMGMFCTQHHAAPINTFACQHCGGIQFANPAPEVVRRGVEGPASNMH